LFFLVRQELFVSSVSSDASDGSDLSELLTPQGLEALRLLLKMGSEGVGRLVQALLEVGPRLGVSPEERAALVHAKTSDFISLKELERVFKFILLPLQLAAQRDDLSAEGLYDAVSESLTHVDPTSWPATCRPQWSELRQGFISLFNLEVFAIENQAENLVIDRPNWVQNLEIASDLRIVPDSSGLGVAAFVLVHTLRISYQHGDSREVAYYAIDPRDLEALELQIWQARSLGDRLKQEGVDPKTQILMLAPNEDSSAGSEGGDRS
jgi:hypothetical protein